MEKRKYIPDVVIKQKVDEIAHKFGLDLAMLFGSFADLRNTKESDVDIAYMKKEKLPTDKEIELANEFEKLFKVKRADIVYIPDASPIFMYMILQNGVILSEREETAFPSLYTYSIKRLYDNMSLYQMRFDYLCKKHNI